MPSAANLLQAKEASVVTAPLAWVVGTRRSSAEVGGGPGSVDDTISRDEEARCPCWDALD